MPVGYVLSCKSITNLSLLLEVQPQSARANARLMLAMVIRDANQSQNV
jgi:hypothetical protein